MWSPTEEKVTEPSFLAALFLPQQNASLCSFFFFSFCFAAASAPHCLVPALTDAGDVLPFGFSNVKRGSAKCGFFLSKTKIAMVRISDRNERKAEQAEFTGFSLATITSGIIGLIGNAYCQKHKSYLGMFPWNL